MINKNSKGYKFGKLLGYIIVYTLLYVVIHTTITYMYNNYKILNNTYTYLLEYIYKMYM